MTGLAGERHVHHHFDEISGSGLLIDIKDPGESEVEVVVSGELDLCSSVHLQDRVSGLEREKTTVVLDLRKISFLDSTGLRALWTIRQEMASAGGALVLRSPSDAVTRLLKLTKLDGVFDCVPDEEL